VPAPPPSRSGTTSPASGLQAVRGGAATWFPPTWARGESCVAARKPPAPGGSYGLKLTGGDGADGSEPTQAPGPSGRDAKLLDGLDSTAFLEIGAKGGRLN
jgi:hypothetical protein